MVVLNREKFFLADGVVSGGGGLTGLPTGVLTDKTAAKWNSDNLKFGVQLADVFPEDD